MEMRFELRSSGLSGRSEYPNYAMPSDKQLDGTMANNSPFRTRRLAPATVNAWLGHPCPRGLRRLARTTLVWLAAAACGLTVDGQVTLAQRPPVRPTPTHGSRKPPQPSTVVAAGPVAPELANRLAAPFQTLVEKRRLRELLTQMSQVGGFNLWLDRRIDPDQTVSLPPAPRTLFGTISQAAAAAGHDAAAIGNLVLVGRPEWVAAVVAAMLDQPDTYLGETPPQVIAWPEATTPSEALRIASGIEPLPDELDGDSQATLLPHDLWPAVRWQGVSEPLATLLVAAQFDQMPALRTSRPDNPKPIPRSSRPGASAPKARPGATDPAARPERGDQPPSLVPLAASSSFVVPYPSGPHAAALRRDVLAADPKAKVTPSPASGRIEVDGSAAAQIAAVRAHLSHASTPMNPKGTLDRVRFSLTLQGISAANVFEQLANTAVHQLVIADDARAACQSLVMLNIQDKTIRELVALVAEQVGVRAEWGDGQLRISRGQ